MTSPGTPDPELTLQSRILLGTIAIFWTMWLLDTLFRGALSRSGIRPRSELGFWGIFTAPLLHTNFSHLVANTIPFVVLAWLIMLGDIKDFVIVTGITWLISGLGVWLFARSNTNHVGASGLIFGYLGFLLLRGYFERSAGAIALSVIVSLLYGGQLWGILPLRQGVSWQGHLFGFAGGVLIAKYLPELRQLLDLS